MASNEISLGGFLLSRLEQLGALAVQGVPGDYNMGFLDLIEEHKTLRWVGNCNELNAAYSIDGYARTAKASAHGEGEHAQKTRIGAVVTTFGVGELSALNGIAGCFSERIPVVHIVGVPSTSAQGKKALLHHTLGDGRFDAFEAMSRKISVGLIALEELKEDLAACVRAIDRVLRECVREARPVYISLPTDMVNLSVSAAPLAKPLDASYPPNEAEGERACLDEVLKRITDARDPIIIVDACAIRHGVVQETHDLIDASGLTVFATPMGKSAVDEAHPQYGGIYIGSNTEDGIKTRVEQADLLLQVGSLLSDFNTANFSYRTPRTHTIGLHSDRVEVGYATFADIRMKHILPKLSAALCSQRDKRIAYTKEHMPAYRNALPASADASASADGISQAYLWPRIGHFLRTGDQVLAETGTSSFGSLAMRLPASQLPCFHSQVLWGSIGWALPACLGVALATREEAARSKGKDPRVVLFIGDGSFQLTAQEISTMVREGLAPIIFVLANDGYEIERQIHGPERRYNNTARWNLRSFLKTFDDVNRTNDIPNVSASATNEARQSHVRDSTPSRLRFDSVRTSRELDALLDSEPYAHGNGSGTLRLVEIIMPRGDAPKALLGQAAATQQSNRY